jgi:hypothetical protein
LKQEAIRPDGGPEDAGSFIGYGTGVSRLTSRTRIWAHSPGHGKASRRNELLAEYYLRAAGVGAVWIDADGHVGAQDVAKFEAERGHAVCCCARGVHFVLAYRLQDRLERPDQASVATNSESLPWPAGSG